jgi:ABC-type branched-subunit amino acid transport system substrate-binding protein
MKKWHSGERRAGIQFIARLALVAAILVAGATPSSSFAGPLTQQEARGKQIYLKGGNPDGEPIFAFIGRSSTKVPAGVLPCGNCHGYDGLGRPEGGVVPSNITWGYLTKSYGHRHRNGRQHPAFDEEAVAAAVAGGLDPAGNTLDPAMPRYAMSESDIDALTAYLKRLETDLDPGLTETTIKVGSVLPSEGPFAALGRAVKAVLTAYFDEINAKGGIYGRKLEFQVVDYLGTAPATAGNVRRLVEKDRVFAVVGAFLAGVEKDVFSIFERDKVPVIGPFTLFAGHSEFRNDLTFHVLSGLPDQARALVDYAALNLQLVPSGVAVILETNGTYDEIFEVIKRQGANHGWPAPELVQFVGGRVEAMKRVGELKRVGVDTVFYFGPTKALAVFAAEAAGANWAPHIFLSGTLSGRVAFELPRAFDDRLFLAYPGLPSDRSRSGAKEFQELHKKYGLPKQRIAAQVSAYVAAKVFVEGLRRSGRALSRVNLVAALEGLSKYETGLTPPVSFGPNRRIGVLGAYVVSVDLENRRFRSDAQWVRLD